MQSDDANDIVFLNLCLIGNLGSSLQILRGMRTRTIISDVTE